MSTRSKSCGADILWADTVNGKKMPLDANPEKRAVLTVKASDKNVAQIMDTYAPHWSSCPNADAHRKRNT